MAALATLSGGLPEEIVSECIRREKAAFGCESVDTAVALQRLRDLLPDEGRAGIAPIRPDIVRETFVLARLGNGQASDGKDAVLRAFADRPSEVATVLVRCVQDFAPRGADAASAREARDQERALAWLRAVGDAPDLPLPLLLIVVNALPQQTLALRTLAVEWQKRAVAMLRQQAAANPDLRATLARNLNNFASRLSDAGQHKEALTIAAEAAALYRKLAAANPDAFQPDLAMSLNNLATRLSDTGQREEVLTIAGEAVELYRELIIANPDAFQLDLALSLNNLAVGFRYSGQREEALKIAAEAVAILHKVGRRQPGRFSTGSGLKPQQPRCRPQIRQTARRGAQDHSRSCRHTPRAGRRQPGRFSTGTLAGSLNNLALSLSDAGQRQEALTIARNRQQSIWTLFQSLPEYFGSYFATAMTTWLSLHHGCPGKKPPPCSNKTRAHVRALLEDADDATDIPANEELTWIPSLPTPHWPCSSPPRPGCSSP
jgi:tetratricopeptide (TPR) repeat protein